MHGGNRFHPTRHTCALRAELSLDMAAARAESARELTTRPKSNEGAPASAVRYTFVLAAKHWVVHNNPDILVKASGTRAREQTMAHEEAPAQTKENIAVGGHCSPAKIRAPTLKPCTSYRSKAHRCAYPYAACRKNKNPTKN